MSTGVVLALVVTGVLWIVFGLIFIALAKLTKRDEDIACALAFILAVAIVIYISQTPGSLSFLAPIGGLLMAILMGIVAAPFVLGWYEMTKPRCRCQQCPCDDSPQDGGYIGYSHVHEPERWQ